MNWTWGQCFSLIWLITIIGTEIFTIWIMMNIMKNNKVGVIIYGLIIIPLVIALTWCGIRAIINKEQSEEVEIEEGGVGLDIIGDAVF